LIAWIVIVLCAVFWIPFIANWGFEADTHSYLATVLS
jgi:hypothetical protein